MDEGNQQVQRGEGLAVTGQVLSPSGGMDNPDNHPESFRLLVARRAALLQVAKALQEQRRAVLSEVGELNNVLGKAEEENQA